MIIINIGDLFPCRFYLQSLKAIEPLQTTQKRDLTKNIQLVEQRTGKTSASFPSLLVLKRKTLKRKEEPSPLSNLSAEVETLPFSLAFDFFFFFLMIISP